MATQRVAAIPLLLVLSVLNLWTPGLALPTVQSSGPKSKPQEITGKLEVGSANSLEQPNVQSNNNVAIGQAQILPSVDSSVNSNSLIQQQRAATVGAAGDKSTSHTNTAEKLKRGLTNFMNHLNPAPYFVPLQEQKAAGAAGPSQATIIQDSPSAEAVIKGPKRLTRPLGSPLRWG